MTEDQKQKSDDKNRKLLLRLVFVSVGMFGFAFALVPLYDVFCDLTGLNGKFDLEGGRVSAEDFEKDLLVDTSRTITIEFVADAAPGLPWTFKPETTQMKIHPGEKSRISFYAENISDRDIVARAVPSISPGHGATHLVKTQCFCFDEMPLQAGAKEEMPVIFHLTEDFPEDISTITLAYKVFDITDKVEVVKFEPEKDSRDLSIN